MSSMYHGEPGWGGGPASQTLLARPRRASTGTKGNRCLMTDAQILEMRALSEFASWSRAKLQLRYGVDANMVERVLSGLTRSRLVATRKHLPADLEVA